MKFKINLRIEVEGDTEHPIRAEFLVPSLKEIGNFWIAEFNTSDLYDIPIELQHKWVKVGVFVEDERRIKNESKNNI